MGSYIGRPSTSKKKKEGKENQEEGGRGRERTNTHNLPSDAMMLCFDCSVWKAHNLLKIL